jgi:hypothetical protein
MDDPPDSNIPDDMLNIAARTAHALGIGLWRLRPGQSAYITGEQYRQITGEDLNGASVSGGRLIGVIAAQTGCAVSVPDDLVIFTKND